MDDGDGGAELVPILGRAAMTTAVAAVLLWHEPVAALSVAAMGAAWTIRASARYGDGELLRWLGLGPTDT